MTLCTVPPLVRGIQMRVGEWQAEAMHHLKHPPLVPAMVYVWEYRSYGVVFRMAPLTSVLLCDHFIPAASFARSHPMAPFSPALVREQSARTVPTVWS